MKDGLLHPVLVSAAQHGAGQAIATESLPFRLTVCVTCVWAGVDSVWEQEKLEARQMLENAADSHTSGAQFVRRRHLDAASSFLRSPLPYTLIMTVELDQIPFGIEKVKRPTVQPTRCI